MPQFTPRLAAILGWTFIFIMAILPFHAFISTWLISNFGFELLFKSWKEILLFFIAAPLAIWLSLRDKAIWRRLVNSRINQLVAVYISLNALYALLGANGQQAARAGFIFNIRFLVIFLVAQVVALTAINHPKLRQFLIRIIFFGGIVVAVFGTMQVLFLPADFLRHFGYANWLIPPYFTIDSNDNLVRILSTLRGPNELGAYFIFWLPILALVTKKLWLKSKNLIRFGLIAVWLCSLITLYGSHSRSAWLGVVFAGFTWLLLQTSNLWRKRLLVASTVLLVCTATAALIMGRSTFVQITLLHHDPADSVAIDSDTQRIQSLSSAARDIINKPFGEGVGATNIASTYGKNSHIVENYYLQTTVELGLVGACLFIILIVAVAVRLWRLRRDMIAAALLASLVGVLVVAMFLPAWGDETLSMLWWGLAGVIFIRNPKKVLQ